METVNIKKSQGFVAFFFVIVILLTVSIFLLFLNNMWGSIGTELDESLSGAMPSDSTVNVSTVISQTGSVTTTFDKLIPFLIIGLFSFVLIGAGAIMKHPAMIFVGIIIFGVVLLLGAVYSNVYEEISGSDDFTDDRADLPIQTKFMEYLPIILFLATIGVVAALIYSRQTSGGGGL